MQTDISISMAKSFQTRCWGCDRQVAVSAARVVIDRSIRSIDFPCPHCGAQQSPLRLAREYIAEHGVLSRDDFGLWGSLQSATCHTLPEIPVG